MLLSQSQNISEEGENNNSPIIESSPQNSTASSTFFTNFNEIKTFSCRSEKLNLEFNVHIENESIYAQQRCFILTIHDIGHDYTQFQKFINCQKMALIRNRVVWIHVDLPGQELEAGDLNLKKYPSIEELGDEVVCVLDFLKIPQVVCMGEGAGANISAYFAIKHPKRCFGCILVQPIGTSAGVFESIKYKMNNINTFAKSKLNPVEKVNLIIHRFDKNGVNQDDQSDEVELKLNDTAKSFFENHNPKNVSLFAEAFLNRPSLIDHIKDLNVDLLIAVGKNSPSYSETKKFYKSLQEVHRKNPKKLVNTPFLEIDETVNVLQESPNSLATSFQYFLQGIGLLSAVPMRNVFRSTSSSTSSYERSISIDEPEQAISLQSTDSINQNPSIDKTLM